MDGMNILLPNRPMVMVQRLGSSTAPVPGVLVFDLSFVPASSSSKKIVSKAPKLLTREYEFVVASTPDKPKDLTVRKRIKRNLANDNTHLKRMQSKPKATSSRCPPDSLPGPELIVPPNLGQPTALGSYDFPITMHPSCHVLLGNYLTHASSRMYPDGFRFKINPMRTPAWFFFAVTDAAMLHAILYSGAIYLALLQGRRESSDSIYHQSQAVSLIHKRLKEEAVYSDPTMGAISCLALGEAVSGHSDIWHVHMKGLQQMVSARGDLSSLDPLLQAKLRRSDIIGASEYGTTPYLTFERTKNPPIWSALPTDSLRLITNNMVSLLTTSKVSDSLFSPMTELAYLTLAIQENINSSTRHVSFEAAAFSETMYWVEFNLLAVLPTLLPDLPEQAIDRACRLGGLLYAKAIIQEFPHSTTGPTALLGRLREALSEIWIKDIMRPLLIWLSMVGACLAQRDMKAWFCAYVAQMRFTLPLASLGDATGGIDELLSLRSVFGHTVDDIWQGVEETA